MCAKFNAVMALMLSALLSQTGAHVSLRADRSGARRSVFARSTYTEDPGAHIKHAGEPHEHSGTPGKGGGAMAPRTHEHGNETEHKFEWTYGLPEDWSNGFADCAGTAQSPIDIQSGDVTSGGDDSIAKHADYVPLSGRKTIDHGHNVQVNGNFGTLQLPDGLYEVKQFHFHFPSEHSVNGKLAAGEIHIVHQKKGSVGTADLAVVGILLQLDKDLAGDYDEQEAAREHSFLQNLGFGKTLPKEGEEFDVADEVDLKAFSKQLSGPFFHYQGSLTTPPCSETVHWYVLQRAAAVTPAMVESFKGIFPSPSNNRPVRPLHGRKVELGSVDIEGEFASAESIAETTAKTSAETTAKKSAASHAGTGVCFFVAALALTFRG